MTTSKIAIVSALAVAVLAAVAVMQQQTIKQVRQENETLKQQAAQVAPLQEQLAAASQEASNATASLSDTQLRDLARLRNEVSQLRAKTNALAKAQHEIQTLKQRVESESAARRDAVAAAQVAAQAESQKRQTADAGTQAMNACINNLRLIDSAKQQWALENKKQITDTPAWTELQPYLGRGATGEMPTCPNDGIYTVGAINERPTCSIPGHVLP